MCGWCWVCLGKYLIFYIYVKVFVLFVDIKVYVG